MLPQERLEQIFKGKKHKDALKSMEKHGHGSECWGIYDGVMVIYDEDDPPQWLKWALDAADEDGHTPGFRALHPAA